MPLLKAGDPAPPFRVSDHTGRERTLQEFSGKRVILWFYPKADTPGWTKEGCGFRDRIRDYEKLGIAILGASFDTPAANADFAKKFDYPFPLLCDTKREVGMAYGACDEPTAQYAKRITYVIGGDGKIERVYGTVDAKTHPFTVLEELGGPPAPK
jgi:thioredoxin-dependent peroxiredoxin